VSAQLCDALTFAILQLCWQATALALLAAVLLRALPLRASSVRYAVVLAALAGCVLAFLGTLAVASVQAQPQEPASLLQGGVAPPFLSGLGGAEVDRRFEAGDLVPLVWTLGVALLSLRLLVGVRRGQRLKGQASTVVPAPWLDILEELRLQQGLRRAVTLRTSDAVESPAIVGWLVPMILVPTSAFTALTPDQLRVVLAHELAHLRRHDHLVNAVQAWIEVLLFFHPAVWWLSSKAREEREHCCDLAALRVTGSPRLLAQALTRLESLRLHGPPLALAARSDRSPLMKRITRILDLQQDVRRAAGWGLPSLLTVVVLALGAGVAHAATDVATPPETSLDLAAPEELTLEAPRDEKEYREIEARLLEAVAAGDLSVAEAQKTLAALRKSMLSGGDKAKSKAKAKSKSKGKSKAPVDARIHKIKDGVEAGKLSEEEAQKKLKVLVEKAKGAHEHAKHEHGEHGDPRRQKYAEAEAELKAAVRAGKLRREQVGEKLEALRKELWGERDEEDDHADDHADGRSRYAEAEAKLKAAVRAGELSREDAAARLEDMRRRLHGGDRADPEARRRQYGEVVRELEGMVKEGRISREDMERRLGGLRARLWPDADRADDRRDRDRRDRDRRDRDRSDRDRSDRDRRDRGGGERRRDGDDTSRLESLERQVEAESRRDSDRGDDPRVVRYREIQAELEAAVDAGKLDKETAEKKLIEVRREMFRPGPTGGEDRPDEEAIKARLEGSWKRLQMGVEAGRLTEEEAKKAYADIERRLTGKGGDEAPKRRR